MSDNLDHFCFCLAQFKIITLQTGLQVILSNFLIFLNLLDKPDRSVLFIDKSTRSAWIVWQLPELSELFEQLRKFEQIRKQPELSDFFFTRAYACARICMYVRTYLRISVCVFVLCHIRIMFVLCDMTDMYYKRNKTTKSR